MLRTDYSSWRHGHGPSPWGWQRPAPPAGQCLLCSPRCPSPSLGPGFSFQPGFMSVFAAITFSYKQCARQVLDLTSWDLGRQSWGASWMPSKCVFREWSKKVGTPPPESLLVMSDFKVACTKCGSQQVWRWRSNAGRTPKAQNKWRHTRRKRCRHGKWAFGRRAMEMLLGPACNGNKSEGRYLKAPAAWWSRLNWGSPVLELGPRVSHGGTAWGFCPVLFRLSAQGTPGPSPGDFFTILCWRVSRLSCCALSAGMFAPYVGLWLLHSVYSVLLGSSIEYGSSALLQLFWVYPKACEGVATGLSARASVHLCGGRTESDMTEAT